MTWDTSTCSSRCVTVLYSATSPSKRGLRPQSYEKGNISRYVSLLKIGDKIRVKGPKGQFTYKPNTWRALGMIAGGTGITPMLQVIRAALKDPKDNTALSLIYANVNFEDILLKKELDELAAAHPNRFKVYYVLNNPPEGWQGGVGFVSKDQVEKWMPGPSSHNDVKIMMCGTCPCTRTVEVVLILYFRAPAYDDSDEVSARCCEL